MRAESEDGLDGEVANTDHQLAARLRAGDESALAEIYDRYSTLVYGIALRTTRDRSAAEDVTQEAFVQIWEHAARFDAHRGSMRAWVATLAHHRAVDHVRRETSRSKALAPAGRGLNPSAEDEAILGLLAERVRAAVDLLPPPQRDVVRLAYYEGHSLVQAATALGVPEGTAKSRMRLALVRLSSSLSGEEMRST